MRLTSRQQTAGSPAIITIASLSQAWAVTAVVAGLLLVFALDWATDAAPVQHLYYLPIILAAARFGRRGGAVSALAAIGLYHLANPRLLSFHHQEADLLQTLAFAAVGLVAAKMTHDAWRLHTLAMTDDLTGLHSLRSFERRLAGIVADLRRTGGDLVMLVLDVDRLKVLNDAHGHLAGAEAVRLVGHVLAAGLPRDTVACRYGGDEFVVALPRTDRLQAREIADRLRCVVHAATPTLAGTAFPARTISISIGMAGRTFVANEPGDDEDVGEALFRQADEALYKAKASGRNTIHVA
ncbi:MAG TPA: GGDEF domain-containing protein [Methylomirabilota bacterium]|nr:GGDEF domain-containing protein [Methylomirabilota bacterium]